MFRKNNKGTKKNKFNILSEKNLLFIFRDRQNYRQLGLSILRNGGIEVAQPWKVLKK
jgi:hypothetical protein